MGIKWQDDPQSPIKGEYCQLSRAWYGRQHIASIRAQNEIFVDDIIVRATDCQSEIILSWHNLPGHNPLPSPKLEMWDSAWEYFTKHPKLFAELAKTPGIQPEEFCRLLDRLGFKDTTPTTRR